MKTIATSLTTAVLTACGNMNGLSHTQRMAIQGGVAPISPCDVDAVGSKQVVNYQVDYIFYKPQ